MITDGTEKYMFVRQRNSGNWRVQELSHTEYDDGVGFLTRDEVVALTATLIDFCKTPTGGLEFPVYNAVASVVWRPNVEIVCVYHDDIVLVNTSPKHPYYPDKWVVPGMYAPNTAMGLDEVVTAVFRKYGFSKAYPAYPKKPFWNSKTLPGPTVHTVCLTFVEEVPEGARLLNYNKFLLSGFRDLDDLDLLDFHKEIIRLAFC